MAHWPFPTHPSGLVDLATSSSTFTYTNVATHASAHTKGAWTEIVTATSDAWLGFFVVIGTNWASNTDTSTLIDIGIGAGGSEVIVLADMPSGYALGARFIPLFIPSGVRVAARAQSTRTAQNIPLSLVGLKSSAASGVRPFGKATTYGTNAAASKGVSVTSGISSSFGSWTQIVAATSQPHHGFMVGLQCDGDTTVQSADVYMQVGVGAAASEVVLIDGLFDASSSSELWSTATPRLFQGSAGLHTVNLDLGVPESTRLTFRSMHSVAAAQNYDVTLIGLTH